MRQDKEFVGQVRVVRLFAPDPDTGCPMEYGYEMQQLNYDWEWVRIPEIYKHTSPRVIQPEVDLGAVLGNVA